METETLIWANTPLVSCVLTLMWLLKKAEVDVGNSYTMEAQVDKWSQQQQQRVQLSLLQKAAKPRTAAKESWATAALKKSHGCHFLA